MATNLQIAMIQSDLVWENPTENRNQFAQEINAITQKVDLIILPEMLSTGFSMFPKKLAEHMEGETVLWMQEMAKEKKAALVGSIIILEDGNYYNRLFFVHPSGVIETYDKRHAFTLAGEDKEYTSGDTHLIVDYKGWKICPLICYDLRFPVWSRNTQNYDLLIYVANWPKPRITAWNTLLKARAIENMSYCIGVNRVGVDANNYQYSGNSTVIDSLGEALTPVCENEEKIIYATLEKDPLQKTRDKLQFLNDKDTFDIQ
ncbi:MAG: amidohydrolase [Flavobacteriaceae bacterium]|nr:amidohydrolase [Flavobacteriaceae bacterium]